MQKINSKDLAFVFPEIPSDLIPHNFCISNICTDTRKLKKGDLFIAITGDNFDGNNFIKKAEQLGCIACIVSKKDNSVKIPQFLIKNTRLALGKIAKYIRNNLKDTKFIGLTGSVGKTTSKQMLTYILGAVANTSATKGNLNNELGVPFTIFDISPKSKFAVIEMGANHLGEISYLTDIVHPDIALITNIGEAHLEGFGSISNIAKAKAEIFSGLSKTGVAVINLDDNYAGFCLSQLNYKQKVITFSISNSKADIFASKLNSSFSKFTLNYKQNSISIELPTQGEHNIKNAIAVSSCAVALGVSLDNIKKGLEKFKTEKGRMQVLDINNSKIINDSYNSNPVSVRSSAQVLSREKGNRIFVFADMAELGNDSEQIHTNLGRELKNKVDSFYCFGEMSKYFAKAVGNKAKHYLNIKDLNKEVLNEIKSNLDCCVLIKGSRSMQMERVVDFLEKSLVIK